MKFVIVFVAIFGLALAAPPRATTGEAQIVRQDSLVNPDSYNYAWETSDGAAASEEGVIKNAGTENEAISVRGQYSFVGDDGETYSVQYVADENGFQPVGSHLPVGPA